MGQQRFRHFTTLYLRGTTIVLIAIDLSNIESSINHFQQLDLNHIEESSTKVVVGCKADKKKANEEHFLKGFMEQMGAKEYYETSSADYIGVEELFRGLVNLSWQQTISKWK